MSGYFRNACPDVIRTLSGCCKNHQNKTQIVSAIQFYDKCTEDRLTENDFEFSKDGSSIQKIEMLEKMMSIKKTVAMIGDFSDRGPKLYSEKAAGGVCGCIGFVEDKNLERNVPNTLLKKDIRDITVTPAQKVYAVMSKHFTDEKYKEFSKIDKILQGKTFLFSDEYRRINKLIVNKENLFQQYIKLFKSESRCDIKYERKKFY